MSFDQSFTYSISPPKWFAKQAGDRVSDLLSQFHVKRLFKYLNTYTDNILWRWIPVQAHSCIVPGRRYHNRKTTVTVRIRLDQDRIWSQGSEPKVKKNGDIHEEFLAGCVCMFNRRVSRGGSNLDAWGLPQPTRSAPMALASIRISQFPCSPINDGLTIVLFCMRGWLECTASVSPKHLSQRGRFP